MMRSGLISLGVALLAASPAAAQPGATPLPPSATAQPSGVVPYPKAPPLYRSNAMRITGIVLTSLASSCLLGGAILMSVDLGGGGSGAATIGGAAPLMVFSSIFAGIGIPLWVVGALPRPGAGVSAAPGGIRLAF